MNTQLDNLKEIVFALRQDSLHKINPEIENEFALLESWLSEAASFNGEEDIEWQQIKIKDIRLKLQEVIKSITEEVKNLLTLKEEEKRKWCGFTNPYIKKITEVIEDSELKFQYQESKRMFRITQFIIKNIKSSSLETSAKGKRNYYTVPSILPEKIAGIITKEYKNFKSEFESDAKNEIIKARELIFKQFASIPPATLYHVSFKYTPKLIDNAKIPEEDLTISAKKPESKISLAGKNFLKTLRAPMMLMFGASFIMSMLFNVGSLRQIVGGFTAQYPIVVWLVLLALLGFFVNSIKNDLEKIKESEEDKKEKLWDSLKRVVNEYLSGQMKYYQEQIVKTLKKIPDGEKDWYESVKTLHIIPHFDSTMQPLKQKFEQISQHESSLLKAGIGLKNNFSVSNLISKKSFHHVK